MLNPDIEVCSCDETMFLRAKLKKIIDICINDTGQSIVGDLVAVANIAHFALKLENWNGIE